MCLAKDIKISEQLRNKLEKLTVNQVKRYIIKKYFKKATEDIVVWKRLSFDYSAGVLRTPFLHFPMERGMHYYQTGKEKFGIDFSFVHVPNSLSIYVDVGLHVFSYKKKYESPLFKCIIPKGSLYLKGKLSNIVTDNLIIL